MTKHIIKYSNRKFYDKSIHKYINLPEILSFVKDGGNIQIMDYDTKEDLTSITLFAALSQCKTYDPSKVEEFIRNN